MKVKLTKEMKNILTINEIENVKEVMRIAKDDSFTAKDYAEMATRLLFGYAEIITAEAEICIGDWYAWSEEAGRIDVLINALVKVNYREYSEIAVKVSKLWRMGESEEANEEIKRSIWRASYIRED